MTEETDGSDVSEQLEFGTPNQTNYVVFVDGPDADTDSGEHPCWQGSRAFQFGPDNPLDVWTPRRLEPDLDSTSQPPPGDDKEDTMPGNRIETLAKQFDDELDDWDDEIKRIKDENDITETIFEEVKTSWKSLKKVFRDLKRAVGDAGHADSFDETYANVIEAVAQVQRDFLDIERLKKAADKEEEAANATEEQPPAQTEAVNPDTEVDKKIANLNVWFTIFQKKIGQVNGDLTAKLIDGDGQVIAVNEMLTMSVKSIMSDLENMKRTAEKTELEVSQQMILCSAEAAAKKTAAQTALDLHMQSVNRQVGENIAKCVGYLSRVPVAAPTPATVQINQSPPAAVPVQPSAYSRLQRIPLPQFHGRKLDYLAFKEEFEEQATYPTEGDKVAALKVSLQLRKDRERVSKCRTLADCWDKLNKDYGDATTLASECSSIIASQPAPTTDETFVSFMDKVEDCVSTLNAIKIGKTYIPTLVHTIENKLTPKMKEDLSDKIVTDTPAAEAKPQFILDFLSIKKAAAKLRLSQYTSTQLSKKNKTEV